MQYININELKQHPRNNEFFDDISGDNWMEFLKSIETSGVIEPIVITENKIIVSGHQRVRACKELKIKEIACRISIYDNDEDKILKDLLETNLRQRGIGNTNSMKFARCIAELENIYGIRKGNNQSRLLNNSTSKTQADLASDLKMDRTQLINYKKLLNLIPELQELVETDKLTATTAYTIWAKLSKEEQEKLFKEIGNDKIIEMTKKETKEYIEKINELESQINSLSDIEPQIIEKEVIPEDYEQIKKNIEESQKDYTLLKKTLEDKSNTVFDLQKELEELKKEKGQEVYQNKLKENASFFCARVYDFIEKTSGFTWIAEDINELPDFEKKSYIKAVELMENWVLATKSNMKIYL